ncbi:hypothetical protein [Glycomyces paridis]|uniref:Uncharacterized protein n=1 Tax=Glycomyces paridis TaxID=2126555 RepID=A0A4S8PEE6_9ACTN|nr:hypothetical protein [Glycomyces paridis]THV27632.1 hypothetical protein E9998_14635 [Glycomyces paridis]
MTAPPFPYEYSVTLALAELGDTWASVEQIAAAREHLSAAIPGWRPPAAYGIGVLDAAGRIAFARVNIGDHQLPAVVMATVLGHRGGSASYRLPAPVLEQAVRLLAPAEACTAYEHPNLAAWRAVLDLVREGRDARMAYLADLDESPSDVYALALAHTVAAR